MSNAVVEVYTPDGTLIGYSVYFGSSDTLSEEIRQCINDPISNPYGPVKCDHQEEPCIIWNSYQNAWYNGTYCQKCMQIVVGSDPNDVGWGQSLDPETRPVSLLERHDGHPFLKDRKEV